MYKAGFVGLIGQPNAGKSTLLNLLVKEKVAIVSSKPQTTRRRVLGIINNDQGQIVFVDAPGVLSETKGLNGFLTQEALDVIEQSDFLLAVIALDTAKKEQAEEIVDLVVKSGKPWLGVLTKLDLEQYQRRQLTLKEMMMKHKTCKGVIELSANWREDLESARHGLIAKCLENLPESPQPLYDIQLFTPHAVKDLAVEIIREKCFEMLHHEIPYNIAIRLQKFDESGDLPKIYAEIIVARESQKPIVIGKKGAVIKEIGSLSRKAIEQLMGQKIFLSLEVSVRDNWFDNKNIMKELGYVVD